MLNEDDIVSVVLNTAETRDALRVIVRVAIREATLRAKTGPPVEDVTVVGVMTIDRLRHTITVAGEVRAVKPRELALIETLARRFSFVFSRLTLLDLAWANPEGIDDERTVRRPHPTPARQTRTGRKHPGRCLVSAMRWTRPQKADPRGPPG